MKKFLFIVLVTMLATFSIGLIAYQFTPKLDYSSALSTKFPVPADDLAYEKDYTSVGKWSKLNLGTFDTCEIAENFYYHSEDDFNAVIDYLNERRHTWGSSSQMLQFHPFDHDGPIIANARYEGDSKLNQLIAAEKPRESGLPYIIYTCKLAQD